MDPLTLALVAGAVLGTAARLWLSPAFETFSKQFIVEVVSNGILAILIPHAGAVIPGLDVTKLPPLAAGAGMFLIAGGAGDFFGNLRKKITGG
jgi:hypothetical protein